MGVFHMVYKVICAPPPFSLVWHLNNHYNSELVFPRTLLTRRYTKTPYKTHKNNNVACSTYIEKMPTEPNSLCASSYSPIGWPGKHAQRMRCLGVASEQR